jgi:hypothetical protein
MVTVRLAEAGQLKFEPYDKPHASGATSRVVGWFQDPYNPAYDGNVVRSLADDEQYDSLVPSHPLSRLRRLLLHIQRTLQVDPAVFENRS